MEEVDSLEGVLVRKDDLFYFHEKAQHLQRL